MRWLQERELSYRIIHGEAVIVHRATNTLHRLNEAGAAIFTAFATENDAAAAVAALRSTFDLAGVDEAELAAEVDVFIADLLARRLIHAAATPPMPRGRFELDRWRDDLDRAGADLVAPVWAKIEVSTRCHLDCVHCYIPYEQRHPQRGTDRGEMTNDEICKVIDELADVGTLLLTITGGEIFIRPGILDVLEHANRRGMILELFTTAMPLTPDKAERLAQLDIARIQISLYSHDATTHDGVTQAIGSWTRSVAAAQELIRRGIHVDFACTLMRSNAEHAAEMKRFAESIGATVSYGYPITARTDRNTDVHALRTTGPELEAAIRALPEFFAMPEAKSASERICTAGVSMCAVSSTGELLPCSQFQLPMGNVRDGSLRTMWESSPVAQRVRAIRTGDLKPSAHGALPSYVGLCPGLNLLEEGDPLIPARVTAETTLAVSRILGATP